MLSRLTLFLPLWVAAAPALQAGEPIINLDAIDPTVDPCDNFYQYACGNWLKTFQLPSDRSSYNRQTDGLDEETQEKLNGVLADYSQGKFNVPAKYAAKLGALYGSCMDTAAIEQRTPDFIAEQFRAIDAIEGSQALARIVAKLHLMGVTALFHFGSSPDLNDSSKTIAELEQGGMSFPDKSYYTDTDAKAVETRARFTEHVQKMLQLAGKGADEAKADAQTVLAVEAKLADKALATEDMQDATQLNHPMDEAGVIALAPSFDWTTYVASLDLGKVGKINVATPEFFKGLTATLATIAPADLKTYLKWHVLLASATSLSQAFNAEHFDFWQHYLAGEAEQAPRWKQCTKAAKDDMTEALAEAYVNSFADSTLIRANAESMIAAIKDAFGQNLGTLDWLDAQTRQAALVKLGKVKDKVGFPDHWQNYDSLTLTADDFIADTVAAATFNKRTDLNKIGQPTDRSIWDMAPWEQNAYYDPPANQMVFPLGALVPPIYDPQASQGANFGSIGGGWMGHELTHGFDSDGRHFDGDGNLVNWWTDATAHEFEQRTQCLIDQANQYEVLPGVKVNGKQTLTENLADQGGVKMGYIAFQKAVAGKPEAAKVGSFDERQQYWVAYAQSWCTKQTPESIQLQVNTDVHPPAEFRTNAVLYNRPEFAADFSCRAGSRMAPVNRCLVW